MFILVSKSRIFLFIITCSTFILDLKFVSLYCVWVRFVTENNEVEPREN